VIVMMVKRLLKVLMMALRFNDLIGKNSLVMLCNTRETLETHYLGISKSVVLCTVFYFSSL
jgi:hypothetical protein